MPYAVGADLAYELNGLMTRITIVSVSTIPEFDEDDPYNARFGSSSRTKYMYRARVEDGRYKGMIIDINPNLEDGPRIMRFAEWQHRLSRALPPKAPPASPPKAPPRTPNQPTVQDCDEKYSYKEVKAMASRHNLPRHLTRKDQMCAELIKRGVAL